PERIVKPLIGLAIAQVLVRVVFFDARLPFVANSFLGALAIGGTFYLIYIVAEKAKKQWIGGGDVNLGIVLGLLAGSPLKAFLVIYIASILGTLMILPKLRH